jgi:Uma2 family endonuclease
MATVIRESASRIPPKEKVTFEEYIEWFDEETRAEWVNGKIELMPSPVSFDHQDLNGFLAGIRRRSFTNSTKTEFTTAPRSTTQEPIIPKLSRDFGCAWTGFGKRRSRRRST